MAVGEFFGVMEVKDLESENFTPVYKAMIAVDCFDDIPEGMETFEFPAGKLAKFLHKGDPTKLDITIKYIFGTWLPQAKEELREGLEV